MPKGKNAQGSINDVHARLIYTATLIFEALYEEVARYAAPV